MSDFLKEAAELKAYMVEQRNYFHSHPELGLKEFLTCDRIQEELNKIGIKNYRVGETNVIGEIDTDRKGKTLFLRADIDALPIQEANDVPYKSQFDGVMHACGHDGHAAYLLGTAKLILKNLDKINGKVILAFQAAEEIGKGARDIIAAGVLDSTDRIFGIHFQAGMDAGKYGIKSGADMASCDRIRIRVNGKAAHITRPQDGVDATVIAALIVSQLQNVVSKLISPVEGAILGIGSIHSGTTYNIISGQAKIEGTIRAFSAESRAKLGNAVKKIAQDVALQYGGNAEVEVEDICDPCTNPAECAAEVVESAKKIVAPENIITDLDKRFGSDNFADYMRKAPGTYVHVGASDSDATRWAHHNEHFDLSEDCYTYAAALALQYTVDFLGK
ncbi:MAG: amidohydrolase [Treponema sp.]|nr:amidohydrolase [Candidatus Treponema equifaecale]